MRVKNVLLVEDSRLFVRIVTDMVIESGIDVRIVSVTRGEEALVVLDLDPDIVGVLLDVSLAGDLTGLDVLERLRKSPDPRKRGMVASLLTGTRLFDDKARALGAGVIPKPAVLSDMPQTEDSVRAFCRVALGSTV